MFHGRPRPHARHRDRDFARLAVAHHVSCLFAQVQHGLRVSYYFLVFLFFAAARVEQPHLWARRPEPHGGQAEPREAGISFLLSEQRAFHRPSRLFLLVSSCRVSLSFSLGAFLSLSLRTR